MLDAAFIERAVRMLMRLSPDLIALTDDSVQRRGAVSPAAQALSALALPAMAQNTRSGWPIPGAS